MHAIGEASSSGNGFARAGVATLRDLVPGELTTLSICDLDSGHRSVVSDVPNAISKSGISAFDRHFHEHPLVCAHGRNRHAETRRISDLVPAAQFRRSGLYNDYYRLIGISHAMAVPIHVERSLLVSFVFNRAGRDFDERDLARVEVIRPHLGDLYRMTRAVDDARAAWGVPAAAPPSPSSASLTSREREVLHWLAGGKTDRDIGDILGISPRTVQKHLQRIYAAFGVETRTAAVVRAMGIASRPIPMACGPR
jgi:DNA-binding CsgD family transcriptional regulator